MKKILLQKNSLSKIAEIAVKTLLKMIVKTLKILRILLTLKILKIVVQTLQKKILPIMIVPRILLPMVALLKLSITNTPKKQQHILTG